MHTIRIRGPWLRVVIHGSVTDAEESSSRKTVQMPSGWVNDLGADFCGQVEYRRNFNKPTGINQQTRIHLALDEVVGHGEVMLNGQLLGVICWPDRNMRFEITGRIAHRNELVVAIRALSHAEIAAHVPPGQPLPEGGLVGEVRLEIG